MVRAWCGDKNAPSPTVGALAMGILGTIVVGLIVGAIARFIMPGEQKMGWILTCVLGVAGALLAGYAGQAIGWYEAGQGAGFIGSVVGALLLLFAYGKLADGKKP
jgi:uncharacterized membrane protein YeaQ/YmgE (transglycosylase-associated protein family)